MKQGIMIRVLLRRTIVVPGTRLAQGRGAPTTGVSSGGGMTTRQLGCDQAFLSLYFTSLTVFFLSFSLSLQAFSFLLLLSFFSLFHMFDRTVYLFKLKNNNSLGYESFAKYVHACSRAHTHNLSLSLSLSR